MKQLDGIIMQYHRNSPPCRVVTLDAILAEVTASSVITDVCIFVRAIVLFSYYAAGLVGQVIAST